MEIQKFLNSGLQKQKRSHYVNVNQLTFICFFWAILISGMQGIVH